MTDRNRFFSFIQTAAILSDWLKFYTVMNHQFDCQMSSESVTRCHLNINSSSADFVTVDEYDKIEVRCKVNYSGDWTPVIRCENDATVIDDRKDGRSVTHTALITASAAIHNSSIVCWTYFENSTSQRLRVAPLLRLSWLSPTLLLKSKCRISKLCILIS